MQVGEYTSLAFMLPAATFTGYAMGYLLDRWLGTPYLKVVFLLLGCVMDSLAIILICVPLFVPILLAHGFDLVWSGIIVVVVTEIALITPPIGMNVFVLKATLPHVRLGAIFRGLTPFIAIDLVRLALLVIFPSISLALVAFMK